jgi:hypothetical protein
MVNQHCFKGVLESRIKVVSRIVLRKCFKTKRGGVKAIGGGGGALREKIRNILRKNPRWQIQMHET